MAPTVSSPSVPCAGRCVCVCVVWSAGSKAESWKVVSGSVKAVFLPEQVGCFCRISPHNPPPGMERDLLSCKHIGSSIENGLTKSIKADMAPIEGAVEESVVAAGRYPPLPLWFPSHSFISVSASLVLICHLCFFFPPSLFNFNFLKIPLFYALFSPPLHPPLNSLLFLSFALSAFFFFFKFHALGSGQPEQLL